ncbi:hypothetical protein [Shimazuella kribbensis]|uniref:hypothetical protein n=1 Tax=Shimazuella kribbensis TaxID=139808 RepID=UPI00049051FF|nr:hypothetical protein [Shimazuella kribbensis]
MKENVSEEEMYPAKDVIASMIVMVISTIWSCILVLNIFSHANLLELILFSALFDAIAMSVFIYARRVLRVLQDIRDELVKQRIEKSPVNAHFATSS